MPIVYPPTLSNKPWRITWFPPTNDPWLLVDVLCVTSHTSCWHDQRTLYLSCSMANSCCIPYSVIHVRVCLLSFPASQVEIDEFQNYDRALGALNEAVKCLGKAKAKDQTKIDEMAKFLSQRIELVQRFANARKYVFIRCLCTCTCTNLLPLSPSLHSLSLPPSLLPPSLPSGYMLRTPRNASTSVKAC